ncbi:MAG TPA: alpha/beta fold hydrolase, partial [Pseudonocardiaceae bacterium]|nr:alpha/beta fold hydrolase [Pseudonocardiaceae bacterium]
MTTHELSCRRHGEGTPLVLLHPLALSAQLWTPLVQRLVEDHAVFAFDLRGHGRSDWDGNPFTISDLADDVVAALDRLGLESVRLAGMSMGGSVAMTLAGRHPDRVRSLLLADTTAWYGPDAPTAWAERAAKATGVPREQQLPFQLDRWFSEAFRAEHSEEVQRVARIFLATASPAHAAASVAMGALDARELLPAITAPTLVLVGEHDYATPPAMATVLADTIPNATLRVLPTVRHLSLIEH